MNGGRIELQKATTPAASVKVPPPNVKTKSAFAILDDLQYFVDECVRPDACSSVAQSMLEVFETGSNCASPASRTR